MINIPYEFPGSIHFQNYDEIFERISKFKSYENIGKDQSGTYDMYAIHLGTKGKPTFLLTSTMHGTEWASTQYSLSFFESLRDNTFPNSVFRDFLLDNFHLILIPVINPWGLEHLDGPYSRVKGRYTFNGSDLNFDFFDFSEKESQNVKKIMDGYPIFAYFDMHMIRGHLRKTYLYLGNGQYSTDYLRNEWGSSWEHYSNHNVELWDGYANLQQGLSRRYMRDQTNPYTPETLSYITEMARPTDEKEGFSAPLSNRQIYKYGMASIYLFFKTSIQYFETYNNFSETIVQKRSTVTNLKGEEFALQATIKNEKEINGNQSLSTEILATKANKLFLNDISEMWNITDFDGVVHKIIYCKRQGVGNSMKVNIKAIPLFFDELDNSRVYERIDEHMTATECFTRIFDGTSFKFVLGGSFDAIQWQGLGEGETRMAMFEKAIKRYECEFRIVGNIVYLENRIGRDTSFMYRYRLNADNIVQEIDANDFWTYARGYGDFTDEEGWEKANLRLEYTSKLEKILGKREAPPIKNGKITRESTMSKQLQTLVDNSLIISVSANIYDLQKQGYPIAQSELGDRVFLIDERIELDSEVRVVAQSKTRDWEGNVVDLTVTFGNEGLAKRHQSDIDNAVKNITDIMNGNTTIPYTVLDDAVRQATETLQDTQTQLKFGTNGIIAIDKNNPNNVVVFNSHGIGVSTDGGNTFKNSITGEGVVAETIIGQSIIGVNLASANNDGYFHVNGSNAEFFDLTSGKKLTMSPDGIYGENPDGSTAFRADELLVTSAALGTSNSNVYLAPDSENEVRVVDNKSIPSDGSSESYDYRPIRVQGVRFKPGKNGYIGTDGELRVTSIGFVHPDGSVVYRPVRCERVYANQYIVPSDQNSMYVGVDSALYVVNKTYAEGNGGVPVWRDVLAGSVYGESFISQTTNAYIGSDKELRLTNKGVADGSGGTTVWRDLRGNVAYLSAVDVNTNDSTSVNVYIRPTSSGEVKITETGTVGTYRPIRASDFITDVSDRKKKKNIAVYQDNTLETLKKVNAYLYNRKSEADDIQKTLGLMIDEFPKETHSSTGDSFSLYSLATYLAKGLSDEIKKTDEQYQDLNVKLQHQDTEIELLKRRLDKLEAK